jgi:hypothetical protein
MDDEKGVTFVGAGDGTLGTLLAADVFLTTSGRGTNPEAYDLVLRLTRDLAWMRLKVRSLHHEIERGLHYIRNRGGQQAGIPTMASASTSTLLFLERELAQTLAADHEHTSSGALLRAATEDGDQ